MDGSTFLLFILLTATPEPRVCNKKQLIMALVPCRECGEMISESAPTCPKCGARQKIPQTPAILKVKTGLWILSILIPIVGWRLYFVKKNSEPKVAKIYGISGIIGLILLVGFVFNIMTAQLDKKIATEKYLQETLKYRY